MQTGVWVALRSSQDNLHLTSNTRYLVFVEGDPIVADSAHRHGVGDPDILHAYNNPIRVEELDDELFMLIGADRAGNLLEIGSRFKLGWPSHRARYGSSTEVSEVNVMPRTAQEIMSQADHLAKHFEDHNPDSANVRDAASLRKIRKAFLRLAGAEEELLHAVLSAREDGQTWGAIGAMLGTSGEAARQRYGSQSTKRS